MRPRRPRRPRPRCSWTSVGRRSRTKGGRKAPSKPETSCWEWPYATDKHGYGVVGRAKARAHRVIWTALYGRVADGHELDHLCRNPCCVNPAHLESVTHTENVRRGLAGENNRRKTHCPAGHLYQGENLYVAPSGA